MAFFIDWCSTARPGCILKESRNMTRLKRVNFEAVTLASSFRFSFHRKIMAFTAHSKLPELNTATILLVGMQGIGKHRLAGALLNLNTSYSLQVRTATHLPLPAENSESRPKIDFVVFLLDANNNMSISKTVASAKELDVSYFLGKACFVVLNATSERLHCTDMSNITGLCDAHDSPMLCGSVQDENQRKILARKLLCLTEISSGFKHAISPMLIQATKHTYEFMETL